MPQRPVDPALNEYSARLALPLTSRAGIHGNREEALAHGRAKIAAKQGGKT